MKAKQEMLLDFLGEPDTMFVIPKYQRLYSWTNRPCEELWRDIFRAARASRLHFVGTVLYSRQSPTEEHVQQLAVVDGQQRLVTATLILVAFARYLQDQGISLFGIDASFIHDTYLHITSEAKLVLSRTDRDSLFALVNGTAIPAHASKRVMENYEFFYGKMCTDDFDPELFWRGMGSLAIVRAELDTTDHPQAIFESFNSKGVPLTTVDLVRNYLLISLNHREQTRLYEQYWEPIQNMFGDDPGSIRLNNAILGWLSVRFTKIRARGDREAFSVFKCYCEDEYTGTTEDLLDELFGFSMVWAENYRYHAVKKFRSANWAKLGKKTLVSDRPLVKGSEKAYRYYTKHFGVDAQW